MASMNSSVLACNYALLGARSSDLGGKHASMPSLASLVIFNRKLPVIRAQQANIDSKELRDSTSQGRRATILYLAAALFATAASTSSANAGIIEELLEKSKENKVGHKRANFARALTVEFGTCKFPENFTGCQDLAKQKKVPFLSDDLEVECKGKDKYKCGSNVFWKW